MAFQRKFKMELQEQVTALTAEKNHYFEMIQTINAEKIALDQHLVETLKQLLNIKKDLLLSEQKLKDAQEKIKSLETEQI